MKIQETLAYDDVLLVPQYSNIRSRSECDTSIELGPGVKLDIPIIASCMDTISETNMAIAMSLKGGMAIIHRYNSPQKQAQLIRTAIDHQPGAIVGAAIGVSSDFLERAQLTVEAGALALCIDVAHGHHIMVKECLEELRQVFGPSLCIIAGNVATLEGVNDLADWGANSIRIGVGGGSICSTRLQTGHGVPSLHTILDCYQTDRNVTLIADGGIRNSGDATKALASGADCIILGSMLAGSDETPGDIIYHNGSARKVYRGMASKEAQFDWRGRTASLEGISTTVDAKGPVEHVLDELMQGIRSGMSYSGARTIVELQRRSQFIKQTNAGANESNTHIFNVS